MTALLRNAFRAMLILATATAAHAQSQGGQSLGDAANDPTSSLMSFELQDYYTSSFHNLPGESQNLIQFRAAIPWTTASGITNIARLTLPYLQDSPSGAEGFSDITIFNLTTFSRPWGRWGVGAVALLPTGKSGISAKKWAVGPAFAAIVHRDWGLVGAFNQNLFTVAGDDSRPDVNVSTFQPFVRYTLANGWSVGNSEMEFVYDWDVGEFTSLPVGVSLIKLARLGQRGVPVQFALNYERNFYDASITSRDQISFTAKLLLPK